MERKSSRTGCSLWRGNLLRSTLLALAVTAVLCLLPIANAQTSTSGVLKGVVTDPSGRIVPNAEVRATNQDTHEERAVKSGQDGSYVIPLLPPGTYQVEVDATGFARASLAGAVITVTETT